MRSTIAAKQKKTPGSADEAAIVALSSVDSYVCWGKAGMKNGDRLRLLYGERSENERHRQKINPVFRDRGNMM